MIYKIIFFRSTNIYDLSHFLIHQYLWFKPFFDPPISMMGHVSISMTRESAFCLISFLLRRTSIVNIGHPIEYNLKDTVSITDLDKFNLVKIRFNYRRDSLYKIVTHWIAFLPWLSKQPGFGPSSMDTTWHYSLSKLLAARSNQAMSTSCIVYYLPFNVNQIIYVITGTLDII